MVGRALSNEAKRQEARRKDDARMEEAVQEHSRAREAGENRSNRAIAKQFQVARATLDRLVAGGVSLSEFNARKKLLTDAEERVLVDFIKESADRGFPQEHSDIAETAGWILESREGAEFEPVGGSWVDRFLTRHRNELQAHWSKPLDMQRAKGMNPTHKDHWFNHVVAPIIVEKNVPPELIYAFDESGMPRSDGGTSRVVGGRGTKTQHKQSGGDKENVTALVTICADGTALRPGIIFKGKRMKASWGKDNTAHASIAVSTNGWTDFELGVNWLEDFNEQTKDKAAGRTRVLFLDGHSSHYSARFLRFAKDNNIEILAYPPHCTHVLQGLDVVCFARLKAIWNQDIKAYEALHKQKVKKEDFVGLFGGAYLRAFTPETVKAAFSATGIYPFNPDVVTADQMKPCEAFSVKAAFPVPLPSPVCRVMAAYRTQPVTSFDVSPSTHTRPLHVEGSPPATPTPSRRRTATDAMLDPALFTPSKRSRLLTSSLSDSASASFLVGKAHATSKQLRTIPGPVLEALPDLPPPDWSLIRSPASHGWRDDAAVAAENKELRQSLRHAQAQLSAAVGIIEGSHAQLTIQDHLAGKLNESLYAKETSRESKKLQVFINGNGRYLTDENFIREAETAATDKVEREAEKTTRKERAVEKRAARVKQNVEWEKIKAKHIVDVAEWEAGCAQLVVGGMSRSKLPKKPKRALKPKPSANAEGQVEGPSSPQLVVSDQEDDDSSDEE